MYGNVATRHTSELQFQESLPSWLLSPWWFVLRVERVGLCIWGVMFMPALVLCYAYTGSPTLPQLLVATIGWLTAFFLLAAIISFGAWGSGCSLPTRTASVRDGRFEVRYDAGRQESAELRGCRYRLGWSGADTSLFFVRPMRVVILLLPSGERIACGFSRRRREELLRVLEEQHVRKARWWHRWRMRKNVEKRLM